MPYQIQTFMPRTQSWLTLDGVYARLDDAIVTAERCSFEGLIQVRVIEAPIDPIDRIFQDPAVKKYWMENYA